MAESDEKKPIRIFGNDSLSSRVNAFQQKAEEHKEKQKVNPFSGSFDAVAAAKQKLNKEDPKYAFNMFSNVFTRVIQ